MTDKKFDELLFKLGKANEKYKLLLKAAEEEFKRRYGSYPGDIDFDMWIDSYHVGCGLMTVKKLEEKMNLY